MWFIPGPIPPVFFMGRYALAEKSTSSMTRKERTELTGMALMITNLSWVYITPTAAPQPRASKRLTKCGDSVCHRASRYSTVPDPDTDVRDVMISGVSLKTGLALPLNSLPLHSLILWHSRERW